MASVGHWHLGWQLPESKIQQDVILTGRIVEIRPYEAHQQVLLAVDALDGDAFNGNAWLYIDNGIGRFQLHQRVQFQTRLKPASTLVNPASDKRSMLVAKRITLTGQVVKSDASRLLSPARSWHYLWSQRLIQLGYSRYLVALLTGNRQYFHLEDWARLRVTGTAHLFSISGMHVGMVAMWSSLFSALCVAAIVRLSQTHFNHLNMHPLVLFLALSLSGVYATLANWQVPVTRAWIGLGLLSALWLSHRHWTYLQRYVVMVLLCIVIFPFSVFGSSFYLSAGAVALLIFITWRLKKPTETLLGKCWYVGKLQLAMSLVLIPITALFFDNASLLVAPVNLLAIPWVTLLVPVGLCGLLICAVYRTTNPLLDWADAGLSALIEVLTWVQPFMLSYEGLPFSASSIGCFFIAMMLLWLPPFPYRWRCCLTLLLPTLTYVVPPSTRNWHVHIFDVGQGNGMIVSKGERGILVDTGPSYEYSDAYTRIIKPALPRLGINTLARIIITHGDDDHAGGVASALQEGVSVNGWSPELLTNTSGCTQGQGFAWQGLTFQMYWPKALNRTDGNGFSCVFTVSDGHNTVLFPGDIPKAVEYELLYASAPIQAQLLIAPHHGSSTSSSRAFIEAVAPDFTVFSTGYYHRWRLPHDQVVKRYEQTGSKLINTAKHGYVRFTFDGAEIEMYSQGAGWHQRWYDGRWYRPSGYGMPE
ncbi:DNA internalization-related competence protein ComEC/Rec2 [Alteromonas sp. C1M14]|uniref:DNA internalization-related competence protein ComEC/Rec2 n=1 Tax=Alteromonas sp. C1M14 TaxID=2841567 RepID=UPI001C0824B7|nr:DNA internalization-related competence protein ComEC/Rec2 [Alteromonas sp. C1M14]MBU2976986.1 DNA internalization-related competence protein ComEC/Rec2 [Alteromonas sp. C1M14]